MDMNYISTSWSILYHDTHTDIWLSLITSSLLSDYSLISVACTLEPKTEVRTKFDTICFSKRPVTKCTSGCRPQRQSRVRMDMICKDRRDPQAEQLRQASHQRVLTELQEQSPTDTLRVTQHESCQWSYVIHKYPAWINGHSFIYT